MTHEEKLQAAADLGLKMRAFISSIAVPEKPELPEKIGYKWELDYTFGENSFAWKSVPDPNAKGTKEKPIEWLPGMATIPNAWYIFEGETYVCVKAGNPVDITDNAYFEQM